MLRFVSGRAASGKTYTVLGLIEEAVSKGEKPVILVPEQFSFETERAVLRRLGDVGAQSVSVISFTRLCDEVERVVGGACARVLSEPDKLILMSKAIKNASYELEVWRNYSASLGFARAMLDTVNEFKQNAVTAQDVMDAAEASEGTLQKKLRDTARIYIAFCELVSVRFLDPSDRLETLYRRLEDYRYFDGKRVFIDSFKGFTGQQYKILDRILAQASETVITLTEDPDYEREIFAGITKTKQRILKIAAAHKVVRGADIALKENHYSDKALAQVECLMAGAECDLSSVGNTVKICMASTVYDEVEFVAENIRKTVRETGCRYGDIVVISRDTAPYEEAFEAACKRNGIGCFTDKRIPLCELPPSATVLAAVDAVRAFSTEKILRFHKTGIDILKTEELSALENYTYLWNINGDDWSKTWDMDPSGFASGEISEEGRKTLERINEIRIRATEPLYTLKNEFHGDAAQMSSALYNLLENCNARGALLKLCDGYRRDRRDIYADAVKQSWDALIRVFDSLAVCFGDASVTVSEYSEALKTALSFNTVGVIPQMLDEVTFGAADRIRPSRPKYAFILGANHGVFPRIGAPSGLFVGVERRQIIELGIEIPDKSVDEAFEEDFLVYSSVCCPTDGLFISYRTDIGGAEAAPSAFLSEIISAFKMTVLKEPDILSDNNLPETRETAFSEFARRFSSAPNDSATVLLAISDDENMRGRISAVTSAAGERDHRIASETAERLFGKNIRMSPTKLEEFNRCRFMYFCKSGLRAKKIQPADFDAMQRGTLIHYVLQRIMEKYKKGISELNEQQISDECDLFIKEYLDGIPGYRSVETPRSRYLVSTMARTVKYVAHRLSLEFAQSDFEPMYCELRIGADGDIPEIKVPVDAEHNVLLNGIVDRLDGWNGYIRIVDYKTDHRDFKLPDILVGQNLQMLIYLYALCKSEKFGGRPAGIFYMPARRVHDDGNSKKRMNGLMQADLDLVCAMEHENAGKFIPKLAAKTGDSFVAEEDFERIFEHIDRILGRTAREILGGEIKVDPIDSVASDACKYCDFKIVCGIGDKPHRRAEKLNNSEVIAQIIKESEENGV